MGRTEKKILTGEGRDRRQLGYYSTPAFAASYIGSELLKRFPASRSIFDPCVGEGELCIPFFSSELEISAMDISEFKLDPRIDFNCNDFLELSATLITQNEQLPYDLWVANPPYNCHENSYIKNNREQLKQVFGSCASLNMYSLFLWSILELAKPGAGIGILTHDSFLSAKSYEPLRKKIISSCNIEQLLLCPLDLFRSQNAEVRTCIMILKKKLCQIEQSTKVEVLNRSASCEAFELALADRSFRVRRLSEIMLSSEKDYGEYLIDVPSEVHRLFTSPRLGELFPCITGISTGNDNRYLRKVAEPGFDVPFFKNPGSRKFYSPPDAFLISNYKEIAEQVSNFIVRNSQFMGCSGITCSSMGVSFSAALLPEECVFGVNPTIIVSEEDRWWLMAYLNSSLVSYMVRGVLNRSNMITSGYVSRLPVPEIPLSQKKILAEIAKEAYRLKVSTDSVAEEIEKIDQIIFSTLLMSDKTVSEILRFTSNIVLST